MMAMTQLPPPDDEPSGYYKVRSSGLADFSRLRKNSTGINPRADCGANMQERKISTAILRRPFDVSDIKIEPPYACLVYSTQENIADEEMEEISNWIISSGCRYAVCAGVDCSEWHDAIDMAYVTSDPNYSPPESRFIMTSWHTNESVEDIVWFWLMLTTYDDNIFENYLLLIVGEPEGIEEKIMKTANEIDN